MRFFHKYKNHTTFENRPIILRKPDVSLCSIEGSKRNGMHYNYLPYDAQIEYLESDGNAYIDTGLFGNQNTDYEVKTMFTKNTSYPYVFGAQQADKQRRFSLMEGSYNTFYYVANDDTLERNLSLSSAEQTGINVVKKVGREIYVNNTLKVTLNNTNYTTPVTITLYAGNQTGGVRSGNRFTNGKIYYIKFYESNVLVRDFIPVRVGTTGYMYDKVSGKLFGNDGSGQFILGEDLIDRDSNRYIEWIKSLGCICYLPMRYEGDLQDKITGKSLQLTGHGSLVWDSSVNKYKVTTSNTAFQYVAWLDNGMNSSTFTNNCFTTLTTFERITTSGYYANCHLSLITNYSNTAASISPCYGGTGNVTNYPAIVKASAYVSPTERIYSQQGEIYLTTTPYNDYTASNWHLTGNGLSIGNIRENNDVYKNKSFYLSEVYVFTTKLNISVIRKIQGYDLYGYNI